MLRSVARLDLLDASGQSSIQGMFATPVIIIAGVSNMVIVPVIAWIAFTGGTAFSGPGTIAIQSGSTNHAGGTALFNGISAGAITGTAPQVTVSNNNAAVAGSQAGVGVYLTNGTQAFTGGSTGCKVHVFVEYFLTSSNT